MIIIKIRSSFVTNSSSSSFIIAYKKLPEIDEETLDRYPFLKGYEEFIKSALFEDGEGRSCWETDAGDVYHNIEDWNEYILGNWGWRREQTLEDILKDDDYLTNMYNETKAYLEKGYNIMTKNVDYSDEYCYSMLRSLNDGENFIILEDE